LGFSRVVFRFVFFFFFEFGKDLLNLFGGWEQRAVADGDGMVTDLMSSNGALFLHMGSQI